MSDEPLRRRRQRRLSDAERTLWSEVVRDVAPFRPAPTPTENAEPASEPPPVPARPEAEPSAQPPRPQGRQHDRPPALAPLGRRQRQRIARGGTPIDGRLDLHGLTQREAHDHLIRFLYAAQDRGATLVLVITGKGAPGRDGAGERGVLRRQVPLWLRLPEVRDLVISIEPAHVSHGGEGALYVRLRRKRGDPD